MNYEKIKEFIDSGAQDKNQTWTPKDLELLKKNFPRMSDSELASLTGHPVESLISKRVRMGLVRMEKRKWTDSELNFIRQNCHTMKDQQIGKALGRTKYSVGWMRVKLGLTKTSNKDTKGQFKWKVKERTST